MYIISENPQAHQSQKMIADALLKLMQIYPYEDITITQICQEAQVARRTFYRNFEFKIDVLEYSLGILFQNYLSNYFDSNFTMRQELECYFEYLFQNKDFFTLLDKHNLFHIVNKTHTLFFSQFIYISKIIDTLKEPKLTPYVLGFISSTICSNIQFWVKNNFDVSFEIIAALTTVFLSGLENAKHFYID
ncbi:TetR-like C-terminal domain-containing protein [uncultured Trichococcus sp.]|uniref:TetR/AcrR family transcriptional regulator n=1 Tax=uncultured Trichococcus sp. TaxID=189665 RepID=UPI002A18B3EE|nr:TetR-like C-terminal domain-containing protein [uncultured Trichococcus sp.]